MKMLRTLLLVVGTSVIGLFLGVIMAAPSSQNGKTAKANRTEIKQSDHVSSDAQWGEPVEGISVRLQADKALWYLSEGISFRASVRNQSKETVFAAQTQQPGELEIDGIWYKWWNPYYATPKPLASGQQFENIRIAPHGGWRSGQKSGVAGSGVGKHTFRYAVTVRRGESIQGPGIRVISNPIEAEFQWSAQSRADTARLRRTTENFPSNQPSVYFSGKIVDDQTGQPITNFLVQIGAFNGEKVTWKRSHNGQISALNRTTQNLDGLFWAEAFETGQAWARVLAEGYQPQTVTPKPVTSPKRLENLTVRMKHSGDLRGVVLDHAGKPVFGARLYAIGIEPLNLQDGQPTWNAHAPKLWSHPRGDWTFKGATATTDADGRFTMQTGDENLAVVSADGRLIWVAAAAEPEQLTTIKLPEPGALIVHYAIPGSESEAQLWLHLETSTFEKGDWKNVDWSLNPTVTNGGQLVLTNLTPGEYEFGRLKTLGRDGEMRGGFCDRRTIVLEAGQTLRVDLVRSTGFSIEGEVAGLERTKASGGLIYVRAAEATGVFSDDLGLPTFDASEFSNSGRFKTAKLNPGTYTIVAEVYDPVGPVGSGVVRTGIVPPSHIGTAKVTVAADAPPQPVKITLR